MLFLGLAPIRSIVIATVIDIVKTNKCQIIIWQVLNKIKMSAYNIVAYILTNALKLLKSVNYTN